MRELQDRRGYQEISTPIVVSERLWRQSGHWDLYRENMFLIESEGQTFSLKPMNCPESTFVYRSHLRSYRDLPLRFNEYGRLHRNERSGTLSGLTRVRQFIQDDAHLYVRPDQLTDEIEALLGEVREAYGWFGLEPRFAFATKPDKALGDPALWDRAEQLIREAFAAADISYTLKPKDGTFYAPKIDIYIDDALGREWQMATIQVDLVMLPERFDLTYIDETGQPQRPIAIHRAIYGSLERFIGILVEHFAGAFPLWIAPVQAVVIPIADRHVGRGRRAGRRAARARPARRGRPLRQPDAEQDPAGAGAEGPVHARPRRPRGRGPDRRPAGPQRGARGAAGCGPVGRPGGSPGRRIGGPLGLGSAVGAAARQAADVEAPWLRGGVSSAPPTAAVVAAPVPTTAAAEKRQCREASNMEWCVDRLGRRTLGFLVVTVLLVAACSSGGGGGVTGGGPTGAPVAAGGDLCKLLGPGDFAGAGVSGAGGPTENNSPPDYFCVYRGKSSATGGIEFDAFVFDTVADAHGSQQDVFGEFDPSDDQAVRIAGADEASLSLPPSGSSDPAVIGVRKGKLTFAIGVGIPPAEAAKTGEALKTLAALVVARASTIGN